VSAVPHPRSEAAPDTGPGADADRGPRRRSLAAALVLGATGATVVLLASGQTWGEGATTAAQGALPLSVGGRDVTAVPAAFAVVALAALVAVFAVRRAGRVVVAAVLALSGAGTVPAAVLAASDTTALTAKAAEATGLTSADVVNVTHTPWPWAAAAGGLLLLIAGLLALRYGRHWPAMSARYERTDRPAPRGARTVADLGRSDELWKALDRGEDPTRDA
jgi:uncharacterized membrane protein (TIGR02234 family)